MTLSVVWPLSSSELRVYHCCELHKRPGTLAQGGHLDNNGCPFLEGLSGHEVILVEGQHVTSCLRFDDAASGIRQLFMQLLKIKMTRMN